MAHWEAQIDSLIAPAAAQSAVTDAVHIAPGAVRRTGEAAAKITASRRALVLADEAGFAAAGAPAVAALQNAGFAVTTLVKPAAPLPAASVEEAETFRAALVRDAALFPVSVGSGVMNDLVKYAAFSAGKRYLTVATAASMDGYASAGAPLSRGGFKMTIPARAPAAVIADLDVIAGAPAEMNACGYGDLAGKAPAGGDWILADLVGAEPLDDSAWSLVQDHLRDWLDRPEGIAGGDKDKVAELFLGLTAAGFAMEAYGSSRPASGAEHQIAHLWEMEGRRHGGRKIAHGAAVAVAAVAVLALFDWLLEQEIKNFRMAGAVSRAPGFASREITLRQAIKDAAIAESAVKELRAKHADPATQTARLERAVRGWAETRDRLSAHLFRHEEMAAMLRRAGAPAYAGDIGIAPPEMLETMQAAVYIRRRYTILDFLHETGLTEAAFAAAAQRLENSAASETRA